jgi:formate dehydrogenase subunit beta
MPETLTMNLGVSDGIRQLLKSLLEKGKVEAVMTLVKVNGGGVSYSLVRDPAMLEEAEPFYPWMPANAGRQLSRLTLLAPLSRPVAAVLRPCELRAFVELVKLEQAQRENLLLISSTCGGVYPIDTLNDENVDNRPSAYQQALKTGENLPDGRDSCRACIHFLPYNADLTVKLVGSPELDGKCTVFVKTEFGRGFLEDVEGEWGTGEVESEATAKLGTERIAERQRQQEELKLGSLGLEGLIGFFGRCIACRNCREVCPICYCKLCDFDSVKNENEPLWFQLELESRNGIRVPPGTVLRHLGRMVHMSASCVGCGMCSDVCPVDIPIAGIFSGVGDETQRLFDYVPGKDEEQEPPQAKAEIKELEELAV